MSSVFSPLDHYCERTAHGLFEEPLNAVTNLAFIVAAWLLYEQYKKHKLQDNQISSLITLIAIIGVGSFAFHIFANYISMLADIIPIIFFVCYFLWVAMQSLLGFSKRKAAAMLGGFFVLSWAINQVPDSYTFNGSVSYASCLLALLLFGAVLKKHKHTAANAFFKACGIFIVSLTFRTMDNSLCTSLPIGTHFMWHILNGWLLYTLTKSLIDDKLKTVN